MALERNNSAMDFETMLRRHVQQGSTSVACEGFDADVASAYLEDALVLSTRADYESHLALCHPCRQQIIQLLPLFHVEPLAQPSFQSVEWWERLRLRANARFGDWLGAFDVRWNGQTAAWAGGALATILVAVFAAQMFRPSPEAIHIAQVDPAAVNRFVVPIAPTPEPTSLVDSAGGLTASLVPSSSALQTSSVPKPEVTPNLRTIGAFAPDQLRASSAATTFTTMQPASAPATSGSTNSASVEMPVGLSSNGAQPLVVSQVSARDALTAGGGFDQFKFTEEEGARTEIASRISLSPSDNPMRPTSLKMGARRREAAQPERPVWRDRVMGFMPYKKEEQEKLEKLPVEEDAFKAMKIRIRDRIFRFENGAWIDEEYKPEMAWRVTKLVRDSAEYERVLAEEPALKAYFVKGAVTVIWRDKIYKVVSK